MGPKSSQEEPPEMTEPSTILHRLFEGDSSALAECVADEGVARRVADEFLDQSRSGALSAHDAGQLQRVAVALAALPGTDPSRLAAALLHVMAAGGLTTADNEVSDSAFALIAGAAPVESDRLFSAANRPRAGGLRSVVRRLWALPGEAGAEWLRRLATADPIGADFMYQRMGRDNTPRWSDEDWPARLDALATLATEPRPPIIRVLFVNTPPRLAGPALTRLVCRHATGLADHLVRWAASTLGDYRGETPADDLDFIDWDLANTHREQLGWLLELMGPPGYREDLVAAASEAGLVAASEAPPHVARPQWADGPVPWTVDEVVDVGDIAIVSGQLFIGEAGVDPPVFVFGVPNGIYPVQLAIGSHPLSRTENVAARIVIRADQSPARYVRETSFSTDERGHTYHYDHFTPGFGVAGIGELLMHEQELALQACDPIVGNPGANILAHDERYGAVAVFTVGPQDAQCRVWGGYDDELRLVELVCDLGVLGLDLEADPLSNPFRRSA